MGLKHLSKNRYWYPALKFNLIFKFAFIANLLISMACISACGEAETNATQNRPKATENPGEKSLEHQQSTDLRLNEKTKKIELNSSIKDSLKLRGEPAMMVKIGSEFNDPGAEAIDKSGNDISHRIATEGEVNTRTLGMYTIKYTLNTTSENINGSVNSEDKQPVKYRVVYVVKNNLDNDGDGMTDSAEIKYGFNPNRSDSFPQTINSPPGKQGLAPSSPASETAPQDNKNKLTFSFSENFPADKKIQYEKFLSKLLPIMYNRLGSPTESFNVLFDYSESKSNSFVTLDEGRRIATDGSFIPRLIAHEIVHVWAGRYTITSGKNWEYSPDLSGFEEGLAEAMAFELIHEYVKSYPTDPASIKLLKHRPTQYWSAYTVDYDFQKFHRFTEGGNFWKYPGAQRYSYSIASTTVQYLLAEEPYFFKKFRQSFHKQMRADAHWRPTRKDIIRMWESIVPTIQGVPTSQYLDSLPVFKGRSLKKGVYILKETRLQGHEGKQQFTIGYSQGTGKIDTSLTPSEAKKLPKWLDKRPSDDGKNIQIDFYTEPFTVDTYNNHDELVSSFQFNTSDKASIEKDQKIAPGMKDLPELNMKEFPVGLYRGEIKFQNFINHDPGAKYSNHFIGLSGINQSKDEYLILVAFEGLNEGSVRVNIDGEDLEEPINNGVAIFRSDQWQESLKTKLQFHVTNNQGESHVYHRRILEAGTFDNYFQQHFLIRDKNFNGIEDPYESSASP